VARRLKTTAVVLCAMILACAPTYAATLSLKEIREAGVVIQKWDTSCGAAAMATVLTYHFNDPVSEREVANGLLRQPSP
jgi:predicted double-glycine peptidase